MSRVFGIRVPVLKHVLNLRTLSLVWRLTRKKSDFQKYHHVNYALLNCVCLHASQCKGYLFFKERFLTARIIHIQDETITSQSNFLS